MIYNMSVSEKVDFLSFGTCTIMKKGLEPSFLTWETRGIFYGGSRHPGETKQKVSILLYFFPTNHDFQRSAPGLIQPNWFIKQMREETPINNIFKFKVLTSSSLKYYPKLRFNLYWSLIYLLSGSITESIEELRY